MDRWFFGRGAFGEEVEVAAFVGLGNVAGIHRAVAASIVGFRGFPGGTARLQFLLGDAEFEAPARYVQLYEVAVAHQDERPADVGLRGYV